MSREFWQYEMLPIVLGNFARQSSHRWPLPGEWVAPTLKFSEITLWHFDTNAETLRQNVQQLKMADWY